jgi:hypothetical protein
VPSSPQELPTESLPSQLGDTSKGSNRVSWSGGSEEKDFFVANLRRRGATKDSATNETSRTPIAELSGEQSPRTYPTLTLDDKCLLQPMSYDDKSDPSVDLQDHAHRETRSKTHPPDPENIFLTENYDLYSSPSPIHGVNFPTTEPPGFTSRDSCCIKRQSGAWSEGYDEWQDAQEWQDARS